MPSAPVDSVNGATGVVVLDTDDVSQGTTNLYYATSLFNTDFGNKTTSDLTEGSNLYYTSARFDTAFSGKSTTNLSEGTNLYYTDARVDSRIGATNLGGLNDVTITGAATNDVLSYNGEPYDNVVDIVNTEWGGENYMQNVSPIDDNSNDDLALITQNDTRSEYWDDLVNLSQKF